MIEYKTVEWDDAMVEQLINEGWEIINQVWSDEIGLVTSFKKENKDLVKNKNAEIQKTEIQKTIDELLDVLIDGLKKTLSSMAFAPETWAKTYQKEINIVEKNTGKKIKEILEKYE